ncbi:hypothetical protein BN131_4091 [Cronobacter malonaticus 681]|nr:hypothetical protein BN131_4091 [Cronobacter malonaticus 681]
MIERRVLRPGFRKRRQQLFFAGFNLGFQFRVLLRERIQRPAEQTTKPGVNIAKGGLPGFEANEIRHHAAIHLTTNTFHGALADVRFLRHQDVAGGGADHFHERIRLCARADRAHMAVKRAAGNHHALRQAEALRPVGAQVAHRNVGGESVGKHRVIEMLVNQRIKLIEEACRRQAAPAFMPQRFMTGAATAAANIRRAGGAGEQGGHPIAQLNPRGGSLRQGAVLACHMQDLGPEPFAGVNPADVARIVRFARRMAQAGDFFRFLHRGVIFPQHEHRVGVVRELRVKRQHVTVGVNRGGRGASAVNADANHGGALLRRELCQHGF